MNKNKKKCIILASGGMDSTTLFYYLIKNNYDPIPLFINYNQHCAKTELNRLIELLPIKYKEKIIVINISDIYKNSNSRLIKSPDLWKEKVEDNELYIPYRNLLFLTIASAYAQDNNISDIYLGFINGNNCSELDGSINFIRSVDKILSSYGKINIKMPFMNFNKYEIVKLGNELGVNIERTYSCQISPKTPCGVCPNCVDRLQALRKFCSQIK